MQTAKKVLKNLVLVTAPSIVVCVLLLEILFRTALPAMNPPAACFDSEEGVFKFCINGGTGTATFGKWARQRGRWRINNHGWNSPVDYEFSKRRARIAVIGDSYIEALQVDAGKSYPSLLHDRLGGSHDVYSFGMSGASLAEYLNISRYVARRFDPDTLIINVIHNDFAQSLAKLNGAIHQMTLSVEADQISERKPRPNPSFAEFSTRKRLLRKSAIVRYLIFNLRLKRTIMNLFQKRDYNANVDVRSVQTHEATIARAVDYVIARLVNENSGRRIVIVLDAPRHDVYEDRLNHSSMMSLHRIMFDACAARGVELLDLTDAMAQDYMKNRIRFNSPYDGHWDEYGHAFVAGQILDFLESQPSRSTE